MTLQTSSFLQMESASLNNQNKTEKETNNRKTNIKMKVVGPLVTGTKQGQDGKQRIWLLIVDCVIVCDAITNIATT